MQRVAGYSEARELTHLIEQLRERLAAPSSTNQFLVRELESVLTRLLLRNQRLRVLHRLSRSGGAEEHIAAIRQALEQIDAQLMRELPTLLERLTQTH